MNDTEKSSKDFASVEEFAAMLSLSVCTVRRMIALGEIPAFRARPQGRRYIIDVRRALEMMRQNKVG
ncbi:MAG: helix-turn-helix domain-containing protein [Spirochaetota bacterium]